MPGPRDPDIEQPSLLLDGSLRLGPLVRKQSVLCSDQPDFRKLKPLGGVQRDQGDSGSVLLFLFFTFLLQHEPVEKASRALARVPLAITSERIQQLPDVFLPVIGLLLRLAPLLQILEIAALLQDAPEDR